MQSHAGQVTPTLSNESELYVAPGGPAYRLARRVAAAFKHDLSVPQRIIGLVLITWAPMCLFAILQGCALAATPRGSFLLDFAAYARFFVAIPVLVISEGLVGGRLTLAGHQLVHDGLVRAEDHPAFERAIARLARRRESVPATLVILALACVWGWRLTVEARAGVGLSGWRSIVLPEGHVLRYSLAALWNHVVAVPVLQFLLYRWLWRILIWTLFLLDVARLKLKLVATHADRAGGLGFLEVAHTSFAGLAFAVGSVISAEAAFRIIYEGARIDTFRMSLGVMIVMTQLLFLGPLLVFIPVLARTRRAALRSYGSLVVDYNRSFQEKWIENPAPQDQRLLGSSDIQSLADIGNSFRFVTDMSIVPFSRRAVVQLALATALPVLPLVLLAVPIREIIAVLAKVVL